MPTTLHSFLARLRKAPPESERALELVKQIYDMLSNDVTCIGHTLSREGRTPLSISLDVLNPHKQQNAVTLAIIHKYKHHPPSLLRPDPFGGWLPLHKSIKHRYSVEVIVALASLGESKWIRELDPEGQRPIHRAIKILSPDHEAAILLMLDLADRNVAVDVDQSGRTAVHVAARYGTSSMIIQLVALNPAALLEREQSTGSTPLHLYVQRRTHALDPVVLRSLALKETLRLLDHRNRSPLDIAMARHWRSPPLSRESMSVLLLRDSGNRWEEKCSREVAKDDVNVDAKFYSPIRSSSFVRKRSPAGRVLLS